MTTLEWEVKIVDVGERRNLFTSQPGESRKRNRNWKTKQATHVMTGECRWE